MKIQSLSFVSLITMSLVSVLPALSQEDLAKRMEDAIANLRQAGLAEPRPIALMLNSAAEGYIQKGDFETALKRVQESLQLCREHDIDPSSPFITASRILAKTDDEQATEFLLGELRAEGASNQYKKGVLTALNMHLAMSGDAKLAVQAAWEKWQIIREESPGTQEEFWEMFQFGTHALNSKLYDVAGPVMEEARLLAIQIGKPDLAANCSRSLAGVYLAEGEYEKALELYDEAILFLRQSSESSASAFLRFDLQIKAGVLMQMDRLDEAEEVISEGETLIRQDFDAALYLSLRAALGLIRELKRGESLRLEKVIETQEKVVTEKLKNDSAGEEFAYLVATTDLLTLASFQLLNGDLDAAEASLDSVDRGIRAQEANLRTAQQSAVFSADEVNLNLSYIRAGAAEFRQQLEMQRGNSEAALLVAENGRGAAQGELMKAKLGLPTSDEVKKELTLDEIRGIARDQETTIVLYSLIHPLSLDTRRFLPRDHPLQSPRELYIWVIAPSGEIHFEQVAIPGNLYRIVEEARLEITQPPEEALDPSPMRLLATLLIDSIESHLPKDEDTHVTIVPQGQLFLIPFAALPTSDGGFLIDRFTLGLSPSIDLLRLAADQKKRVEARGNTEILLVGNPTMPGYQVRPDRDAQSLSPLPGAEAEAKYLSTILNTEPLIGDAATEDAVASRMESARILHFATHGLLETDSAFNQGFLSSLAFAPSPGEDGFLTVRETARLDLAAELAVLSACDTGRGTITGDGVIGLSRGYITAGVPTVVVSLWPVNDDATAKLMGFYYEELDDGEGKASALRSAMLKTREQFPEPSLWSPFVLYGLAR